MKKFILLIVIVLFMTARSYSIDKLGYDFSSSVVIDLNNQRQLEAVGKALKVNDFFVDQVSLQRDLLREKDKAIADYERKAKFERR